MTTKKEQRLRRARQTRIRIADKGVCRLSVNRTDLHIYATVFSADGTLAFVTNARAATLAVFNARTKVPVATISLSRDDMTYQPTMLGSAALPIGVVAAADRPRAYVAISGGDRIAVIDTQRWQVIDYWVTGREPDALGIVAD